MGKKLRALIAKVERRLMLPGGSIEQLNPFHAPCQLTGILGRRLRQSLFELHMGTCVVLVNFKGETELYPGERLALSCQSDSAVRMNGQQRLCFRVLSYSIN